MDLMRMAAIAGRKARDNAAEARESEQLRINRMVAREDFYLRATARGYDLAEHGARLFSFNVETKTWE